MNVVWTIAASDSGGCAGIERDLKTMSDCGVHGCSVITALTCQNSESVLKTEAVPAEFFRSVLSHLWSDIRPKAVKIGLIPNSEIAGCIVEFLSGIPEELRPFVVYDPVLCPTAGGTMSSLTYKQLRNLSFFEYVDLITPNIPEFMDLCRLFDIKAGPGEGAADEKEILALAAGLQQKLNSAVLITGGHRAENGYIYDVLQEPGEESVIFRSRFYDVSFKHGTGCTLSSAVASFIAGGYITADAVTAAVMYAGRAVACGYAVGRGGTPASGFDYDDRNYLPDVLSSFDEQDVKLSFPSETFRMGLYPVVGSIEWIRRLLGLGVRTLQLRIKDPDYPELEKDIAEAIRLGREYGARLYIDDYWQMALKYGAYGVHLGQEDLKSADLSAIAAGGLRLGVSTHGYREIAAVLRLNPSYVALGHIFPTGTKVMKSKPQGLEKLGHYVRLLKDVPTVAIGGIKEDTLDGVLAAGVGSVAVVSLITAAGDPDAVTKRLLEKIHD